MCDKIITSSDAYDSQKAYSFSIRQMGYFHETRIVEDNTMHTLTDTNDARQHSILILSIYIQMMETKIRLIVSLYRINGDNMPLYSIIIDLSRPN